MQVTIYKTLEESHINITKKNYINDSVIDIPEEKFIEWSNTIKKYEDLQDELWHYFTGPSVGEFVYKRKNPKRIGTAIKTNPVTIRWKNRQIEIIDSNDINQLCLFLYQI